MSETTFALLDDNGVVVNVVVADKTFVDELKADISDPDVDTGDFTFANAVEVTGQLVSPGHKRGPDGKFTAPIRPKAIVDAENARLAAEQARTDQRTKDAARVTELRAKTGPGKAGLSPAERDELMAIQLSLQLNP